MLASLFFGRLSFGSSVGHLGGVDRALHHPAALFPPPATPLSRLLQPLISLVERIHLNSSPAGHGVEGRHQGSANAAFGSKMDFHTESLGVLLRSPS